MKNENLTHTVEVLKESSELLLQCFVGFWFMYFSAASIYQNTGLNMYATYEMNRLLLHLLAGFSCPKFINTGIKILDNIHDAKKKSNSSGIKEYAMICLLWEITQSFAYDRYVQFDQLGFDTVGLSGAYIYIGSINIIKEKLQTLLQINGKQ